MMSWIKQVKVFKERTCSKNGVQRRLPGGAGDFTNSGVVEGSGSKCSIINIQFSIFNGNHH